MDPQKNLQVTRSMERALKLERTRGLGPETKMKNPVDDSRHSLDLTHGSTLGFGKRKLDDDDRNGFDFAPQPSLGFELDNKKIDDDQLNDQDIPKKRMKLTPSESSAKPQCDQVSPDGFCASIQFPCWKGGWRNQLTPYESKTGEDPKKTGYQYPLFIPPRTKNKHHVIFGVYDQGSAG